jgi:hypothetical protein
MSFELNVAMEFSLARAWNYFGLSGAPVLGFLKAGVLVSFSRAGSMAKLMRH